MNLINKVLILGIIIVLINHLTDGSIINTLKRYKTICVEKMSNLIPNDSDVKQIPFANQLDFPYINQNDPEELDEETYNLYRFLDSRVRRQIYNYELTLNHNEVIEMPDDMLRYVIKSLHETFNSNKYEFKNIKLSERLQYTANHRGKEIIPFKMSADVFYDKKPIGSVVLQIDSFIHEHLKGGLFSILNIKLISRKHVGKNKEKEMRQTIYRADINKDKDIKLQKKQQNKAMEENKQLNNMMNESFNSFNYDEPNDLFIKSNKTHNDDIDIPTVNISDYEGESDNITTENK